MKFIVYFALIVSAMGAQARDLYNFKSLGFSADGKYYGFQESVVMDGSGFPSATVAVIDVASNTMLVRKTVVLEADTATETQAIRKALQLANPAAYGIGAKSGQLLLARENSDYSTYTETIFGATYYRRYTLIAESIPVIAQPNACYFSDHGYKLKLTLAGDPASNPLNLVMQEDATVPKVRSCAWDYSVRRVIQLEDKLVVIVSYHTEGFEGSNVQFMAVTAKVAL